MNCCIIGIAQVGHKQLLEIDSEGTGLGMTCGHSLHLHYHPCKSRKKKLGRAMKSPPKGKAAWADITRTKL